MRYAFLRIIAPTLFACLCACSAPPTEVDEAPVMQDTLVQEAGTEFDPLLPAYLADVWEMPSAQRWDDYWEKQYGDSTGTLGHRQADFDGDGTVDHALLVSRKDTTDLDSTYAVVIRFFDRDTVLTVEPWAEADGYIGIGLDLEPTGKLGHLGGEEGGEPEGSVELKQPAVTLVYFEKASITWYWNAGSFHKVWTGD